MKTTFISTLSLHNAPRSNLTRLQTELANASKEISTGRLADVGRALGHDTGRSVKLRDNYAEIEALIDSNEILANDLARTQSALGAIFDGASALQQILVGTAEQGDSGALLQSQARDAMSAFLQHANATDGRRYLFAGINSGEQPIADFNGAPKLALDTAFSAKFGIALPDPQNSPLVRDIDAATMADFLDNEFAGLFESPAWEADWSSASDTNLASRISPSERIETSANANEPAMRKLAMAYTMVAELGTSNLSGETLQVVIAKAREVLGSAAVEVTNLQSRIGIAELRVESASERMRLELDIVSQSITTLEGADPVEAKVRFDTLSTQIEMSYALTTRVLQLSILNYA